MVVQKNGQTAYEAYFNGYTGENALHVFSVTKSVVNALIGIAIGQGFLQSVEQTVPEFFPDCKIPEGEKTIRKITIGLLFTMTLSEVRSVVSEPRRMERLAARTGRLDSCAHTGTQPLG